jgi:dihydrofolate reductase
MSFERLRGRTSGTATTQEDGAMGDLVVTEFMTLDGVIQDPGGAEGYDRGGWAFKFARGPEGDKFKFDELMASDAQLLGRVTYEGFAKAWPTMEGTGEFGEKFNSMPKYVVSTTLEDPAWNNSHVLDGNDLAGDVAGLKQQYAGNILVAGSAQLAQSLIALDLVDELRLMIFPTVLGAGKRLFADDADTKSFDTVDVRQSAAVSIITLRRNA